MTSKRNEQTSKLTGEDREKCLFRTAVEAWARYCEQHGYLYDEPSETLSTVGRKYVHLRNARGEHARYNLHTRRIEEERG
jgi:hypothetical protein